MIFNHAGQVVGIDQMEHEQIYPKPGWVEHDPMEIWARSQDVIKGALAKAHLKAEDFAAIGVTNQRETTVVWNKKTGKPVYNAIVWQDTRTKDICDALEKDGGPDRLRPKTGLPLATYFSGPEGQVDPRQRRWRPGRGRGWRPPLRQHRHLVHLEPDRRRERRRPRDGRLQRQPHAHVQLHDPRLGSGDHRPPGRAALDAPRRQGLVRGLRQRPSASWTGSRLPATSATSRPPSSARPASRPARRRTPTARAASCSSTRARRRSRARAAS